jgi:hypothetical protein
MIFDKATQMTSHHLKVCHQIVSLLGHDLIPRKVAGAFGVFSVLGLVMHLFHVCYLYSAL